MMPQQKQMMQLLDYLNLREAFETDGVFDENRPETVNASPEKIADYKVYNNKYDQNNIFEVDQNM